MHQRMLRYISVLLFCVLLLSGCGQRSGQAAAPGHRYGAGTLTFVTSFYPVYISVINVTRDVPGVRVINMTKTQTGCLHDYQLTPGDLKLLENADVFIVNGAGMEAFMDKVVKQQPGLKVVEAARGIDLIRDKNGQPNPHVWVSISGCIRQVAQIAGQLAVIDPANGASYRKNAGEYTKRLEALRSRMHESLDGIKSRDIVTLHEAFPYFAKEFNLHISAVIEREPGTDPTPKELESIVEAVRNSGSRVLFAEPQYSTRAADAVARETGAKVYMLDPVVTGEARQDAYDAYIASMEKNLKVLEEALK